MNPKYKFSQHPLVGFIAALSLLAAPMADAVAETATYYLDQSQKGTILPDGTNYLKLEITSLVAGTASFSLSTAFPFVAGSNYGLQAFAFNYSGSGNLSFDGLQSINWSVSGPSQFDGYGTFDYIVAHAQGGGVQRVSQLNFNISGIGGTTTTETLSYFAKQSGGNAGEGHFYFGGHLADFSVNGTPVSSIQFAGSTVAAVPEPESYAMLLAGLGMIGAVARRRRMR